MGVLTRKSAPSTTLHIVRAPSDRHLPLALAELVEDESIDELAQCAVEATKRASRLQRDLRLLLVCAIGLIEACDANDLRCFDARLEALRDAVVGMEA